MIDIQKKIAYLDSMITVLQDKRAALIEQANSVCRHREPSDKVCTRCGGVKYIYCTKKKHHVKEPACNSKCKKYKSKKTNSCHS
jgi:hypothetical protein